MFVEWFEIVLYGIRPGITISSNFISNEGSAANNNYKNVRDLVNMKVELTVKLTQSNFLLLH